VSRLALLLFGGLASVSSLPSIMADVGSRGAPLAWIEVGHLGSVTLSSV
jgi:hypothetical protein